MTSWLLALLLAASAAASDPAPEPATRLAPDSEARWVPFELTANNQIRFTATLEGMPVAAILDTGLSDTVATQALAARLALKRGKRDTAQAIGGTLAIEWADSGFLSVGGLTRLGGRVAVADLAGLGALGDVELFVGADMLGCCALDIDYDARRFRILRSGRMPFTGATAPLARARGSSTWVTELSLGGRRLRPMLVDTGDGASVTLARTAWDATGERRALSSTLGYGMGGPAPADVAVVSSLELAGMPAREAEVRIEDARGYSESIGAAGRIGSGFLQGYRVLLDPRAGRMVLRAGAQAEAPVLRSTSGLLMTYADARLTVIHVMRGSPAARGGWRTGETICAADGVPVAQGVTSDGLAGWSVGAPGRTVRLGMCDGGERSLRLARFY